MSSTADRQRLRCATLRRAALACAALVCAGPWPVTQARSLTPAEAQVLRGAPVIAEQNTTPEHLARYQAAERLARELGRAGVTEALPVLAEARQLNVINGFVAGYTGPATPELEALALKHFHDSGLRRRLVAMARGLRSPALFDALLAALPNAGDDCEVLLQAAAGAEVPNADGRLAALIPRLTPAAAEPVARRFARNGFRPAEAALIELLKRAPLDRRATVSGLAAQVIRLHGDPTLNAAAAKLVEVARLSREKPVMKFGLISSLPGDGIVRDGKLCPVLPPLPQPLGDAREQEVRTLMTVLRYAPADATLDRKLLDPARDAFTAAEQAALIDLIAHRDKVEASFRTLTPDNFVYWAEAGQPRLLKALIARGADVNATSRTGMRPLVAARLDEESVALLLAAGANPKLGNAAPDREGRDALQEVCGHQGTMPGVIEKGQRVVHALLSAGADVRRRDATGATALHRAAGNRPELVSLLLERGAEVNAADRNGTTPLHVATHAGQLATVKLLLDKGANPNAEELGGATARLIAHDNRNVELEKLLADRGGRINQVYRLKRDAALKAYELMRRSGH